MVLWRGTLVVSLMTLLSRILGMVRDVLLIQYFGAGKEFDAFAVAFKIPNFFRKLFVDGAFANAFVPVLSEYQAKHLQADIQILISRTFASLLLCMSGLTLACMVFAPYIIYLYASGFVDDVIKFSLTVDLFRILLPYVLLISLTAFASSVLNSYGRFFLPALTPILLNLLVIFAILFGLNNFSPAIKVVAWAIVFAGLLQFAVQMLQLWRMKLLIPPKIDFHHQGVRKIMTLLLPALFSVSITQINLLFNTMWASYMQEGSISWLYAAERLTELPLGLIGVAIAIVILPSLSKDRADHRFGYTMDWAVQMVIAFGLPASIGLFMLAKPIIVLIFSGGDQFTMLDVQMTALALQAMSVGMIAVMLIKILTAALLVHENSKSSVRIGVLTVIANVVLTLGWLAVFYGLDWQATHVALSLGTSCAAFFQVGLLCDQLFKDEVFVFKKHWLALAIRFFFANLVMILVLNFSLDVFDVQDGMDKIGQTFMVIGLILMGVVSYLMTLRFTGFKILALLTQKF